MSALSGCAREATLSQPAQKWFESGHPLNLISETSQESEPILAVEDIRRVNGFRRVQLQTFSEYNPVNEVQGTQKSLVCGASQSQWDAVHESFLEFQEVLEGHLVTEILRKEQCPSFSDVNTNKFYFIDGFLWDKRPEVFNAATTLTVANLTRSSLVSSDIFIWLDELSKIQEVGRAYAFTRAIPNEIGHFFGLDDFHDPLLSDCSVMTYNPQTRRLCDYDREMLQNLNDE